MGTSSRIHKLQAAVVAGLGFAGVISSAPPALATTLSATLQCESYPSGFLCDGAASGGTGEYTFTWSQATSSRTDTATTSSARFSCPRGVTGTINFTVQDSSGATAQKSSDVVCGGHL